MLNATAKVASTFSDFALSAATNSLALGDTAWRGVDVFQIEARKCEGRLVVDSEGILLHWMESRGASTLVPSLGPEVRAAAAAAALALTGGLPETDTAVEYLRLPGNYSEILMQAALTDTGLR